MFKIMGKGFGEWEWGGNSRVGEFEKKKCKHDKCHPKMNICREFHTN